MISSSAPISSGGILGEIVAYYGSTNPEPDKLIPCDGSTYDTTEFSELYTLLGTNTTPDLTDFVLTGDGVNSGTGIYSLQKCCCVGDFSGPKCGSDCMPFHTHNSTLSAHTHTVCCDTHCHSYKNCASGTKICTTYGTYADCVPTQPWTFVSGGSGTFETQMWIECTEWLTRWSQIGTPNSTSAGGTVRVGTYCKGKTKSVRFFIRGKV